MTSYGESAAPHAPIASVDVLDPAHPLQADLREPIGTSTMLAAATGRYELAFRLATADAGPASGIADLVEYASDGMRASQGIDLKPLFSDPWQFGRPDGRLLRSTQVGTEGPDRLRSLLSRKRAAKQRAAGKENDEAGPAGNALPAQAEAYFDMRAARFSHGNFEIRTGSGPTRIIVTDLPLAGHEALVLRLRAASAAISASIRLLDQQWGSVIAQARSRAASPEISATLDLKRVFLQATLIVEVEGEDETAFQVTELRLE
jgi:hypothetical protein